MSAAVVHETAAGTRVVLDPFGFYATCDRCPWVGDGTPSKFDARRDAEAHDEGGCAP